MKSWPLPAEEIDSLLAAPFPGSDWPSLIRDADFPDFYPFPEEGCHVVNEETPAYFRDCIPSYWRRKKGPHALFSALNALAARIASGEAVIQKP